MVDIAILTAICAVLVTAAALVVDAIQTRSIRKINAKVEAFQGSDVGQQFGDWLLEKEDPNDEKSPTNLEACAHVLGSSIAQSFSMAAKGIASGESRTLRSVEKAVLEGLETPETKALLEFCDQIGVNRELGGYVYQILEKHGYTPQILKNNGGTRSEEGVRRVW